MLALYINRSSSRLQERVRTLVLISQPSTFWHLARENTGIEDRNRVHKQVLTAPHKTGETGIDVAGFTD